METRDSRIPHDVDLFVCNEKLFVLQGVPNVSEEPE